LLAVDVGSYLPGDLLPKVDIATMAHSLEARSPLLDAEVMEFAARLPERMKLRGAQKKWLLRGAYRSIVPAEILDGRKRGFGVPLADWLRGPLKPEMLDVLCDPAVGGGMLDRDEVTAIVDSHLDGRADNSARIWALLFLERWRTSRAGSISRPAAG
jgi:asparagine synthase (glutamine-hydrolysing)